MKTFIISLILISFLILSQSLKAQINWTHSYGYEGQDAALDIKQTHDKGYIFVGFIEDTINFYQDAWLCKLDSLGNFLWDKKIGDGQYNRFYAVHQTIDGGYLSCGFSRADASIQMTPWLVKTDDTGNIEWERNYDNVFYIPIKLVPMQNEEYVIVGGNINSSFLIKTDKKGDILWTKNFDKGTKACNIKQTLDGGYLIVGAKRPYPYSTIKEDFWIAKFNRSGDLQWSKEYGGIYKDEALTITLTIDEGYLVSGSKTTRISYSGQGYTNIWLLKLDFKGDTLWTKTFGGHGSEAPFLVKERGNRDILIAGYTGSYGTTIWLIKCNAEGHLIWSRVYEKAIGPSSIQGTEDGGLIISSGMNRDAFIIKTDSTFNTGFGNYISHLGQRNVNYHNQKIILYQNYPNPFNAITHIQYFLSNNSQVNISLFDVRGRKVKSLWQGYKPAGTHFYSLDAENLTSGIYYYSLNSSSYREFRKMLLVK